MAGFYTALIGTSPTIQWPGLSPPCTAPAFTFDGFELAPPDWHPGRQD